MTIEERAHRYEHSATTCEVPGCSCCPALIEVLRTAEAEAYRRGQEAFRERVLELNMYSYDHEMIRKLPIEEEEVADGR